MKGLIWFVKAAQHRSVAILRMRALPKSIKMWTYSLICICCPRAICSRFLKKKTFDSPLRKICRCLLKKTLLLEPVQVQKIRPSKRCCQKVYLDTNLAFGRCDAQQTPSTITLPQQKQQIVSNKYTHTHHKIIPHLITILVQCVFDKQSAKSTLKSNAWWMHSITVLIVLR